jgi:putative inorganic carbon (HCO3(-)) transporter
VSVVQATGIWWRPESRAASEPAREGRVAFGALATFTAILLLSPQTWVPVLGSLRIAFVAAGIAILAHLLDRAVRRQAIDSAHPEMIVAMLLVGWSVVTLPFSYWPGGSVAELTDHFLKAVIFFWLIATIVTTRARLRSLIWLLVVCSIPLALTALQNYRSGVFVTSSRMAVQRIAGYSGSGIAANPNDLALMLNLLIPLAGVVLVTTHSTFRRLVAGLALFLSAGAIIVTFSRAGFLSLAATALMTLIALGRRQPLAALAVVATLGIAGPLLLPAGYVERLSTITAIDSDPTGSAQGRWSDYAASAELIATNPVTGAGLGQNILALNDVRGETWRYVHNVYLQYAVDLGIPGLLLFLWLFIAVFRAARRVRRRAAQDTALFEVGAMAEGVQIALVTFAVAAIFHPVAYQFYFFCVAGLALAVKNALRDDLINEAAPALQTASAS